MRETMRRTPPNADRSSGPGRLAQAAIGRARLEPVYVRVAIEPLRSVTAGDGATSLRERTLECMRAELGLD
jgi:hypothetical protein